MASWFRSRRVPSQPTVLSRSEWPSSTWIHATLAETSRWCFYATLFLAPLSLNRGPEGISPVLYVSDVPLVATILLWTLAHWVTPEASLTIGPRPLVIALFGLVVTAIASSGHAVAPVQALDTSIRIFLAFGLFTYIVDARPSTRGAALALGLGAGLNAALAVGQYVAQRPLGLERLGEIPMSLDGADTWLRGYGLTPHPNILGGFTALGIISLTGIAVLSEGTHWRWCFLGIAILSSGLAVTFSRSVWIGLLVAFVILIVGTTDNRLRLHRVLSAATMVAASMAVFIVGSPDRYLSRVVFPLLGLLHLSSVSPREMADLNQRVVQYATAFQLVRRDLLFGIGVGNFTDTWQLAGTAVESVPFLPVHNVPVLIATEQGLIGLSCWLLAYVWIVRESVRRWSTVRATWTLLWTAILAGTFAIGFFDYYFWGWEQGRIIFWSIFGLWIVSTQPGQTSVRRLAKLQHVRGLVHTGGREQ